MKRGFVAFGLAVTLLAGQARSAELEYGVAVGVGTSDNIRRAPIGEENETILTTGVELGVLREEGRFLADVDVDLTYFEYQDESYDGEVTGSASADLRFLFVPGRFEWIMTENFGQSQLDPFSAITPDNRENVNYFTTGPEFVMRLGTAGSLTLFGRYSATSFEDTNFDDERLLGGLALGRDLTQRSRLSLNATAERVEFDDATAGSDYDRQSAFLRYDITGARTTIGAEVGYTEIHDGGTTNNSPLFELNVSRELSERAELTFSGGLRSSDAASALRAGTLTGGGGISRPDQVSTTDTFETRHATLGWHFAGRRTQFELSIGHEEDRYDSTALFDREWQFFQASASREITPRFHARIAGSLYSSNFSTTNQDDDETQYGIYLSWNIVGRLYVHLDAERFSRDSSDPLTEFDESRAFLRFAWRNTGGGSGSR